MQDLACHRCSRFLGEAGEPVEFVGMFKDPRDRGMVPVPRWSWRCKACGWVNVFRRVGVDKETQAA